MKFFRDVLGTFVTEISIVVLNFLAGVLLARLLPPQARGILALVMLFPVTLAYFADIGISQAIIYFIGRSKYPVKEIAANGITIALILGGTSALVAWAIHDKLLHTILNDVPVGYLGVVLALLPVLLTDTYLLSILRGRQQFSLFNFRRLLTPLFLLAGVLILVGVAGLGVNGAVLAFVASTLLGFILTLLIVRRAVRLSLKIDRKLATEMTKFGVKSYIQNLVGHLHYRLDIYLLALFVSPVQVAFYTVATSVAEAAFYIPDSVGTVLFPKLSSEPEERISTLTAEVARHTLWITTLALIGISLAGWALIPVVYGPAYRPAVVPFLILVPGILAMAIYKVLTRNYTSRNRQQVSVLAAGVALIFNIGLNLFLIPRLGVAGAALASLLSYTASAIILLAIFRIESGIPLQHILIIRRTDFFRYLQVWYRFRSWLLIHLQKSGGVAEGKG